MPEFEMKDLTSFRKIVVHFRSQKDIDAFAELIGQKITKAPSLWYPEWKKRRYADILKKVIRLKKHAGRFWRSRKRSRYKAF